MAVLTQAPPPDSLGMLASPFVTDLYGTVESIVTVLAILVGGIWTYQLFVKRRVRDAKLELTHSLLAKRLDDGKILLHLTLKIQNVGEVLVHIRKLEAWIQQVTPVTAEATREIEEHDPMSLTGALEIQWPLIGERETTWGPGQFEIEPGESDDESIDFVVDGPLEVVRAYTRIPNEKKRTGVGWSETRTGRCPRLS